MSVRPIFVPLPLSALSRRCLSYKLIGRLARRLGGRLVGAIVGSGLNTRGGPASEKWISLVGRGARLKEM